MATWAGPNQLQAVILPTLVSAFGVFFMRQYLVQALPTELIEAARVDGASSLRVVWHVVFPAARPAMAVLGMLTFVHGLERLPLADHRPDPAEPDRAGRPELARHAATSPTSP